VRQPARPDGPHLPAQERPLPQLSETPAAAARAGAPSPDPVIEVLRDGEIEVVGRLVESSNNALLVRLEHRGADALAWEPSEASPLAGLGRGFYAVWKPTIGERPLFDFPIGTLTRREVAAYVVSDAIGWSIVPATILREGPYGEGMLQRWIEVDPEVDLVGLIMADDPRLRRIALFDAILNNTDRKGGHVLPVPGGHLFAVDHGVTFSIEPKLRTILWAWEGQPFAETERAALEAVAAGLRPRGPLDRSLRELLAPREVVATRRRVEALLVDGRFPSPNPDWPAIPWPPF
jgi:uncharacterized repeat protein (TIGR03843 family)